jgi:hypothetical protein
MAGGHKHRGGAAHTLLGRQAGTRPPRNDGAPRADRQAHAIAEAVIGPGDAYETVAPRCARKRTRRLHVLEVGLTVAFLAQPPAFPAAVRLITAS